MYGTVNVKRKNGEGITFHSVHSVEIIEKANDFTDLDIIVFVPGDEKPSEKVIEVRLLQGERAYEMNGLAETVAVYYGGLKR